MSADWITGEGEGAILRLRVTPKASADAIEGTATGSDGLTHLRVRVRALPDKGAANTAVIKLLAKALGVPKTTLELVSGHTSRVKSVRVSGRTPEQIISVLAQPG